MNNRQRTWENIAHSFRNHPYTPYQTPSKEAANLQKFWHDIASLLEWILTVFLLFCHLTLSIRWNWYTFISAGNSGFCDKTPQKMRQKTKRCRISGQKHRTFWVQTSVLSMPNLRTLWQRSLRFPVFSPEMAPKSPSNQFCDISGQDKARRLSRPFSTR